MKPLIFIIILLLNQANAMSQTIIDFTQPPPHFDLVTDATEREPGKSHGTLTFQPGLTQQKTFFFAFLDPQPNGAAFVSVKLPLKLNLSLDSALILEAQGLTETPAAYQVILETSHSQQHGYTYQHRFVLSAEKQTVRLPLEDFEAVRRGKLHVEAPRLDPADIQAVGFRIIGRDSADESGRQQGLFGMALTRLGV